MGSTGTRPENHLETISTTQQEKAKWQKEKESRKEKINQKERGPRKPKSRRGRRRCVKVNTTSDYEQKRNRKDA